MTTTTCQPNKMTVQERDALISANVGLAHFIAGKACGFRRDQGDIRSAAMLGLVRAANTFTPSRGRFAAYAWYCIRSEVVKEIRREPLVRLPPSVLPFLASLKQSREDLIRRLGRDPSADEIALAAGCAVWKAEAWLCSNFVSTDFMDETNYAPDGMFVDSNNSAVNETDLIEQVRHRVAELPPRRREIVLRHFGLDRPAEDIRDISASLHISRQAAYRHLKEALRVLRQKLFQDENPHFRNRKVASCV